MEYVLRYDVKPARGGEFKQWLQQAGTAFGDHAPDGWTYEGTYFTVRGFGDYSNETRWRIESYAALGSGFGDADSIQLISEWMDFVDQTRPWQATLYKEASEVDILPGT